MEIIKGDRSPCKLVDGSGDVLTEGTHTHCTQVWDEILTNQREVEDERNAKSLGTDEQGY